MMKKSKIAFTIIELLVVISIISMLIAILIPALGTSKNQAKMILCKNNLRQLVLANQNYSDDHHGYCAPGAMDIDSDNLHRWYGIRPDKDAAFDPSKGPLANYLQSCELSCPQKTRYKDLSPSQGNYEYGNRGYGYNLVYVGSRIWESGYESPDCEQSTKLSEIDRPNETLFFADTAMVKRIDGKAALVRYAFAEPRFFVLDRQPNSAWSPAPSIHFRHRKKTCIAWADGHADDRKTARYDGVNDDGTKPLKFDIGWFSPMDNSLFDLK